MIKLWKEAWLNFRLRTCDVMAPHYGEYVVAKALLHSVTK